MEFEVTIGIEIHCELLTKTKIFSLAPVAFDEVANSCVHQNDLALPGTLPILNKKAVELALRLCYGLNMEVDSLLRFDRKNYFYSDLPKGFQITQQRFPIGQHGQIMIEVDGEFLPINITRLHLEEDTAKQFHYDDYSALDFNRAGIGLIEIVSEPEIKSAKQAISYVSALRQMILALQVSDAKMEEGSLRCDINISLAPKGSHQLGTKVEIKNLNSLNNIQLAIEDEIKQQSVALANGEKVVSATKRFDEETKQTVLMRKKETAIDYRYFPEPNIPPTQLDKEWMNEIKSNLPELPYAKMQRYLAMDLALIDVKSLMNNNSLAQFFDQLVNLGNDPIQAANYCLSEVLGTIGSQNVFAVLEVSEISKLLFKLKEESLSSKQAKVVLKELIGKTKMLDEIIQEHKLELISDQNILSAWIEEILMNNPQVVTDFKNGKDHSLKYVMGMVMKKSKGQANPKIANALVQEILKSK